MRKWMLAALPPVVALFAAVAPQGSPQRQADEIIAVERAALDRWGRGDPSGYLTTYAEGVTYFDPFQEHRLDGLPALRRMAEPIAGTFSIDRYEMIDPRVQSYGDVAVLSYQIVNYKKLPDGSEQPTSRWNSTAVFHQEGGRWRTIHSHFSFTRPQLASPASP